MRLPCRRAGKSAREFLDFSRSNPGFWHPNYVAIMWNMEFKQERLLPMIDSLVGGAICGLIAVMASAGANGHVWRTMVPLVFIGVLLLVSLTFGAGAGVLGTVLATVIFAVLLFNTRGSIQVADEAARANLAWMLLLGVSLSFLLAPASASFRRR